MENPVYSNDLVYLRELIIIMIVTTAIIYGCFYISKKADRRRARRIGTPLATTPNDTMAASDSQDTIS